MNRHRLADVSQPRVINITFEVAIWAPSDMASQWHLIKESPANNLKELSV
jgi:hypothetical protein